MKKLKLLFVHDATFKYDENGTYYGTSVNNYTLERYKYISDDISVMIRTVPFSERESKLKYTEISNDYKIISIPNLMSVRGITFEYKLIQKRLEQEISEFDCVVARLSGLVGEMAAEICIKQDIPCIVECVGNPWDSLWYSSIKGKVIAPYFYLKTKKIIKRAKYVIYVTNEYLQRVYPTKGKQVGCSNVTLPERDEKIIAERRKKILKKSKSLVLGSAGKVDMKYKGYQYVIKAIKKLDVMGIEVRYEIAGGGDVSYLSKVAKDEGVEDRVIFKGIMPHEDVLTWMDTLDMYIQPSNTEGLPRALIEAMSRGCPSVGSDAGGIPELLNSNYIFKKKNIPEMISVIRYAYEHLDTCSDECYKKSAEYTKQVIVNKRNAFFAEFIHDNKLK